MIVEQCAYYYEYYDKIFIEKNYEFEANSVLKLAEKYQNKSGFQMLLEKAGSVKTWGNCFGYMLLVRGLADAVIDPIMSPWDLLPLIPVVRGAGGIITDYQGQDPLLGNSIIAATPSLHLPLIDILNPR